MIARLAAVVVREALRARDAVAAELEVLREAETLHEAREDAERSGEGEPATPVGFALPRASVSPGPQRAGRG